MRLHKPHWVTHGIHCKSTNSYHSICSLDIHPDGTRLATGGLGKAGGTVIVWDMSFIRDPSKEPSATSSKQLFRMEDHEGCVNTVRWSPTGRWLATGSVDHSVIVWEKSPAGTHSGVFGAKEKFSEHWRRIAALRNHSGDVVDLAWSQDGTRLASTSIDCSVAIYGVSSPNDSSQSSFQLLTILKGHKGAVKGVTWDPAGRFLATHSDDLGVRIWRTADWQIEATISKFFPDHADQTALMRLSWSPDGSYIAAPHAVNGNFPVVQLLNRNRWQATGSDLVGHEKHLTCARYNPNIMKKAKNNGFINILCLAIGGKDRCLSVWSTARRRALVVLRDLFTHSISDLTWSASGHELMVCSLDGSIAYLCFTKEELGEPLSLEETVQHHRGAYGQSLIDNLLNSSRSLENNFSYAFNQKTGNVVLETPEALALQRQQEELRQRTGNTTSNNSGVKVAEKVQWTSQKESRTKDGRRRITPSFLHTVQSVVEAPNSALPPVAEESSKDVSMSSPPKAGAISTPVSKSIEQPSGVIVSEKTPTLINDVAIKSPSTTAAASSATLRKQQQEQIPLPKAKKRVEMTTITGETKTIEKRSTKTPTGVKKRKRIKNLDDDEGEDVPVLTATKTTIQDRHPSAAKTGDRVADKIEDRGAAQTVTFRAPQLKVADQMDLCGNQAQFVCDHPIDGPIVVKVANAEGGKNAVHKITGSQSTDGNVKTVWTFLSSYRFTSHAHSGKWLAAGDVNSNLRLLWSTGCAICPPLRLDSPAQILAATVLDDSTEKLAVLTVSGCLTIWKLSVKMLSSSGSHLGCSMEKNLPKIVLTTKLDNTRFPAVDLTFSPGEIKHPVVYFKLGSSALFHVERKLWVELFNAGEGGEDSFKRRAAATLYRTCPSGPLSEMQKFGRLNVLVTGDLSANTPSHRRDLQEFYDAQIQVAEMFGSAAEFKFWLSRWFQQLIIESDERRIRQVCLDFIGPVSSALNTSWESTIKGLSKRSLMKQLFPHFAMNLGMQRLYVEMKELFDNTEDSE